MTRKLLLSSFLVMIILSIVLSAAAHSGRTDSNGGHIDHSTGKYHYHHGYSAHDHYDMDGDRIADCPYEFDDKTDGVSENRTSWVDALSISLGIIAIGLYVFFMFILPFIY